MTVNEIEMIWKSEINSNLYGCTPREKGIKGAWKGERKWKEIKGAEQAEAKQSSYYTVENPY